MVRGGQGDRAGTLLARDASWQGSPDTGCGAISWDRGSDDGEKVGEVQWLDKVMVKSSRFDTAAVLLASVGGDRDEGRLLKREIGTKPSSDFIAVKVGEPDIEQGDLRLKLRGEFKGVVAVRRGSHFKTSVPQQDGAGTNDVETIVHDEHSDSLKCLVVVEVCVSLVFTNHGWPPLCA